MIHCTFSTNSAGNNGGAIISDGTDGQATIKVLNCTFSGNSTAGLGGAIRDGNSSPLIIGSTIFQQGASGANLFAPPIVTSLGYNLSSDNGSGFLTGPSDKLNTVPLLGSLQNNGGSTLTHALLPNSPALDQGKNFSGFVTEQRGLFRTIDSATLTNAPGGDGTDIGAVEMQPPVFTFTVLNTNDNGFGSLRAVGGWFASATMTVCESSSSQEAIA